MVTDAAAELGETDLLALLLFHIMFNFELNEKVLVDYLELVKLHSLRFLKKNR